MFNRILSVYLAGPLFTPAERYQNYLLAKYLEAEGLKIFLPQRDINGVEVECVAHEIRLQCVRGVLESDAVLACLDGPDPDSGTCWEVGYAQGLGKPVFWYRTDFRRGGDSDENVNLMLGYSGDRISVSVDISTDLLEAINRIGLGFIRTIRMRYS